MNNMSNEQYFALIKHAAKKCDAFCLVFYNEFPYKLPPKYVDLEFANKLEPYLLHQINRAKKWPGGGSNAKYHVFNIYKFCKETKNILSDIGGFNYYENHENGVEDLCFLIKHRAWLVSISHEKLYWICNETKEDIDFFKLNDFQFNETFNDENFINECDVKFPEMYQRQE